MLVFLQTLEGWVYKDPIHGPLDGPLYMGSIYSNTPPQSELPAQRCSRLDNKKANTSRSLNYQRSGVQDWTRRKYKGQRLPPAATTSHLQR